MVCPNSCTEYQQVVKCLRVRESWHYLDGWCWQEISLRLQGLSNKGSFPIIVFGMLMLLFITLTLVLQLKIRRKRVAINSAMFRIQTCNTSSICSPLSAKTQITQILLTFLMLEEQFLWISIIFPNRIYFSVLQLDYNRAMQRVKILPLPYYDNGLFHLILPWVLRNKHGKPRNEQWEGMLWAS